MQSAAITGSWKMTKLFCIHNHEEPIEMIIKAGPSSLFFACPKYDLESLGEGERRCNNRLSMVDFTNMLDHFSDVLVESEMNDIQVDLTNMVWKNRKGIVFKVLKHTPGCLEVGVINMRAIRS